MHKQLGTILSVMVFSGCALLAQETGVTEDTDATITQRWSGDNERHLDDDTPHATKAT